MDICRIGMSASGRIKVIGFGHLGSSAQLSVEGVGPAVVFATQVLRTPAVAGCQRPGPMAADVVECSQAVVLVSDDDDGSSGDFADNVVTSRRQIAGIGDELPASGENRPRLHCEGGGISVWRDREGAGPFERLWWVVEMLCHR